MSARLMGVNRLLKGSGQAVVLYDDLVSLLSAETILDRWPQPDVGGGKWAVRSWHFEMLQPSPRAGQALVAAESAHLLLFATAGTIATPAWVERWVERWASSHRQTDVIVGLVLTGDPPERQTYASEVGGWLRQLAERYLLAFRSFQDVVSEDDLLAALCQFSRPTPFPDRLTFGTLGRGSGASACMPAQGRVAWAGGLSPTESWSADDMVPAQSKLETEEM
jgi:hypothetical protein